MDFVGKIFEKEIYAYDPQVECDENDIMIFLSHFNRLYTLRKISDLSAKLFQSKDIILLFYKVPIMGDVLLDLALKTIKYSNDLIDKKITENEFVLALRMCIKVSGKDIIRKTNSSDEILIYLAYKQFIFQEDQFIKSSRNIYIYRDLWYKVKQSKNIDVLKDIQDIIGIPYEAAMIFSYALLGSKDSYFWVYDEKTIDEFNKKYKLNLDYYSQKRFLDWCSADYDQILNFQNDLNPLIEFPIIETKSRPRVEFDNVYLVISYHSLFNKITSGIYYCLADKYNRGGKNNKFKEAYGFVFQEYIGVLLKYHFHSWTVHPEIRYDHGNDTVDWLITKDNKAILVEVKQSSITLESKETGQLSTIENDLKKTLIKAARQLKRTEDDIKSEKYKELIRFKGMKDFEKIIITGDPFYFANSLGKNIIEKELNDSSFNYSIININDFERILANQQKTESLFELLSYKNLIYDYKNMDFKEYILKMYPNTLEYEKMLFLYQTYSNFFSSIEN